MIFKLWLMMLNESNRAKIDLLKCYKYEDDIFKKFDELIEKDIRLKKKYYGYDKLQALEKAKKLEKWLENKKIEFITINDEIYPLNLKNLNEPPYGLFLKGNINLINSRNVAVIGSRICTNYGMEITKLLTKELISFNISIISGGAKGIDSVAHNACVDNKGNTICVLGCGIDIIYPAQNKFLFEKIEKEGLIISEFLPGEAPHNYNFPRRNRIISGLSELVIVVEASEKSGSLITANYAADQGKHVMAVPGSIFSKGSNGCNKLIRDGAHIFTSLEDLHTILKLDGVKRVGDISPMKEKILSLIRNEPIHIDEIIKKSYVDRATLYKVLFEMQITNEIVSLPGNFYAKIT